MATNTSVARRYATAIVEAAAARSDRELETVTKELEQFAGLMNFSFDLRHTLISPVFTQKERMAVLQKMLGMLKLSDLTTRFLTMIGERNRFSIIEDVARSARRLADARANRLRADVEAAAPLTKDAEESLRRALERRTGKAVELKVQVDPSLLGGVRARIGSIVLDGTLRSQLEQLKESLLRTE